MMIDDPTASLRQWILESGNCKDISNLGDSTNLLEEGYIDSLGFLGLIVYVEELLGTSIGEADMTAQNFHSIQAIKKTFFHL